MDDLLRNAFLIVSAKFLTIGASFTMAIIAVGLDARRHSIPSAILAIFAGTIVGVISATAICALFGLSEQIGYGISAVGAVSANNMVRWLLRVSNDPISLWERLKGGRGEE